MKFLALPLLSIRNKLRFILTSAHIGSPRAKGVNGIFLLKQVKVSFTIRVNTPIQTKINTIEP